MLLLDPDRTNCGLARRVEVGHPLAESVLTESVPVIVAIETEFREFKGRPLQAEKLRKHRSPIREPRRHG